MLVNETIKAFYLERLKDESGVSGTGIVAYGTILPSGHCVLEWVSLHSSINIYKNIQDVELIHLHGGSTVLKYFDTQPIMRKVKKK